MTECPHPHDRDWLKQQLAKLPPLLRQKAALGYESVWRETYDAESVAHKKSNAARYAANTRLVLFIENTQKTVA